MTKLRVGVIFGGKSAEHEVSLQSAKNIVDAIDKEKFDVTLLGIDKQGQWHINDASNYLLNAENPALIALNRSNKNVALIPGQEKQQLIEAGSAGALGQLDVIFPIVHGTLGEDGSLQGLLRMANMPFVGAGVLGSAVSMDKDVTKRLLRDAGLAVAPFVTLTRANRAGFTFEQLSERLGLPLFVKPANQVVINEINTLPGFTNISMYPKLWAASGVSYQALITRLIELALERHQQDRALNSSVFDR